MLQDLNKLQINMSAAIVKKKRVSRKNKAGWSKVDIADVENFQEEQRVEVIEG